MKNNINFQVDARDEQCFFDKVKQGTKMGLIFEVAEGGALDIDVKIEGIITLVKISDYFLIIHMYLNLFMKS